jgi:hypothetical protein
MSIDNYIWVPAGARYKKPGVSGYGWTKYKSFGEMPDSQKTPHQVFLAHQHMIDEQYFFEDADDARWFWLEGYKGSLILDDDGKTPMSYDRMALWIGGEEVASRGYVPLDRFDTEPNYLPTGERRCDRRYKAVDSYGDVEWARCTNRATLRIIVTPAKTVKAMDGSAKVIYTTLPAEAYEALTCAGCYEDSRRSMGTEGNPAKVEFAAELRPAIDAVDTDARERNEPLT